MSPAWSVAISTVLSPRPKPVRPTASSRPSTASSRRPNAKPAAIPALPPCAPCSFSLPESSTSPPSTLTPLNHSKFNRAIAFGYGRTVLFGMSSRPPSAKLHGRHYAPRCSRSTLLSLDERDDVSFCRTVALDISLGHRKRGMSGHLLDVAKRSTCLCNPLRDGCDEGPPT